MTNYIYLINDNANINVKEEFSKNIKKVTEKCFMEITCNGEDIALNFYAPSTNAVSAAQELDYVKQTIELLEQIDKSTSDIDTRKKLVDTAKEEFFTLHANYSL